MKKPTAIMAAAILTATMASTGGALAKGAGDQNSVPLPGTTHGTTHGMMGGGSMGADHNTGHAARHATNMGHASHHYQGKDIDKKLSADDVRKILDGHFAWMGYKRLKVGDIKKQPDGIFITEIDTVDGSLVMHVEVDPKTGAMNYIN